MKQWSWTARDLDALYSGTMPRDKEQDGVVEAESLADAAVRVVRDEIKWLALDDPVAITLEHASQGTRSTGEEG